MVNQLTVEDSAFLAIKEGVTFVMCEDCSILVKGVLEITGSKNDPVIVTSNQTEKTKGFWDSIIIENGNEHVIRNAVIEYGGSKESMVTVGKNASVVEISGCEFSNSQTNGLTISNSSNIITECSFNNNDGDGLLFSEHANATLVNCDFSGNGKDGLHYNYLHSSPQKLTIERSSFSENSNDGLFIETSKCDCELGNYLEVDLNECHFEKNEGNGITVDGDSDNKLPVVLNIQDTIISENVWGASLDSSYSFVFDNTLFLQNQHAIGRKKSLGETSPSFHGLRTEINGCTFKDNTIDDPDDSEGKRGDTIVLKYIYTPEFFFTNNTLENNYGVIRFEKGTTTPIGMEITDNEMNGNYVYGKSLFQIINEECSVPNDDGQQPNEDVRIEGNIMRDNYIKGSANTSFLAVEKYCSEADETAVFINDNEFLNPMFLYELSVGSKDDVSNEVDATNNWWGYDSNTLVSNRILANHVNENLQIVTYDPITETGDYELDCDMCHDPRMNCDDQENEVMKCKCPDLYYPEENCEEWICGQIPRTDREEVCGGHGDCVSPDNCTCSVGYSGDFCGEWSCESVGDCNSQGECVAADTCRCKSEYYGVDCSIYECNGVFSNETEKEMCSGHGDCVDGSCECIGTGDYTGNDCEKWACFGFDREDEDVVCSNHGTCIGSDDCSCTKGYDGDRCDETTCFGVPSEGGQACSGHGTCEKLDFCECDVDYSGSVCNFTTCYGILNNDPEEVVCSGHGDCFTKDDCECYDHFYGDECDVIECNGVHSDSEDPEICSGHGECKVSDGDDTSTECECEEGYFERFCNVTECDGIRSNDPSVCTNHGSCVDSVCECDEHYGSEHCGSWTCWDVNHTETEKVCTNGNGECTAYNKCDCSAEYEGPQCETEKGSGDDEDDDDDDDDNDDDGNGPGPGGSSMILVIVIIGGGGSCVILFLVILVLACIVVGIIVMKKMKRPQKYGMKTISRNERIVGEEEDEIFGEFELPPIDIPSGGSGEDEENLIDNSRLDDDDNLAYIDEDNYSGSLKRKKKKKKKKRSMGSSLLKKAGESSDEGDLNFTINRN